MKILLATAALDIHSGGPPVSIYNLAKGLRKYESNTEIIATSLKANKDVLSNEEFINYVDRFFLFNYFVYSFNYLKYLKQHSFDIIHVNGFWQYPPHISCKFARKNKIPYIITPRGMISPKALSYSRWIKKIALLLYQKKDLKKARVIHVTGKQEIEYVRLLGLSNPVAVIPNPIEVKEISNSKIKTNKKRIAFIGRLHVIKNIETLLKAWSSLNNNQDWELVFIGDGESEYLQSLKSVIKNLEIKNVMFTGFLIGNEKEKMMQTLNIVILPSFSENFGMVVGESLQYEIPVIASTGTPWVDLNSYQCGWWVNNDVETLSRTIEFAISLPEDERLAMGKRGRKLILEKYSIEAVSKQMLELYEWVLNGKEKPKFIYD